MEFLDAIRSCILGIRNEGYHLHPLHVPWVRLRYLCMHHFHIVSVAKVEPIRPRFLDFRYTKYCRHQLLYLGRFFGFLVLIVTERVFMIVQPLLQ